MKKLLFVGVLMALACGSAHGLNYSYKGGADGVWTNPANWDNGSGSSLLYPNLATDNVLINNGFRVDLPASGTITVGQITTTNGALRVFSTYVNLIVTNSGGLDGSIRMLSTANTPDGYRQRATLEVWGDYTNTDSNSQGNDFESGFDVMKLMGDNKIMTRTNYLGTSNALEVYGSYTSVMDSGRAPRTMSLTVKDGGEILGGEWGVHGPVAVEGTGTISGGRISYIALSSDNTDINGGKLLANAGVNYNDLRFSGQLYNSKLQDAMYVYKMDGAGNLNVAGNLGLSNDVASWRYTVVLDMVDNNPGTPRDLTVGGNLQLGAGPSHGDSSPDRKGLLKAVNGQTIRIAGGVTCGGTGNDNPATRDDGTYTYGVGSLQLGGGTTMYVGGRWLMNRKGTARPTSEFIVANWNLDGSTVVFDGNGNAVTQVIYSDNLPFGSVKIDTLGTVQLSNAWRDEVILHGDLTLAAGTFDANGQQITFNGNPHYIDMQVVTYDLDNVILAENAVLYLLSDMTIDEPDNLVMMGGSKLYLNGHTLSAEGQVLVSGDITEMAWDAGMIYGTGVIPEPGTMLLLGTGLLGAVGYFRRRRLS